MSETTTYLRVCSCGARYEPPLGLDPEACRKCRGMICPLCSGPTLDGRICPRDLCQRALVKWHEAALREDRRRESAARPEIRLVRGRRAS